MQAGHGKRAGQKAAVTRDLVELPAVGETEIIHARIRRVQDTQAYQTRRNCKLGTDHTVDEDLVPLEPMHPIHHAKTIGHAA